MKVSRLFFDRLLWAGAVFMAIISLVVIVTAIRTVRDASQNLDHSPTFFTEQIEFETMLLVDGLDQFSNDPENVRHTDVMVRFRTLKSRVFDDTSQKTLVDNPYYGDVADVTIATVRATLQDIEPKITNLSPDDVAEINALKEKLRQLVPLENHLRHAIHDTPIILNNDYIENQLSMTYLVLFFTVGMILFGILSITLLRVDRIQISSMNARLEKRVRQRTKDLHSANSQLAAEITERERNQTLATEREARLEQAVQLAKLGYYLWDVGNDCCEFCSGQHAASFGLTPAEYLAKADSHDAAMRLIHPEDRDMLTKKYQDLRNGQTIEVEYRVLRGNAVRRLREVARPIFDNAGKVHCEVGSTIDITDQYNTEMKLFEAQKMDTIGKMTGGVAHDFNNLLAVILGNLELLKEVPDIDERDEMIEDAINATLRGRDLTMSMLSFARRAPLDPSNLDLNEILSGIKGMLRRTLPENIFINVTLKPDIWTVVSDRSLTESAVLNLVINARDAMADGGVLTIETENITLHADHADANLDDLAPGDYVRMTVKDTGRGINADLLPHIFEPFFTTKAITNNSGLGLSMVQGFIHQIGGAIRLTSKPGQGTTFHLYFKALRLAKPMSEPKAPTIPHTIQSPLRVLLVEDDDTVRKVLTLQMQAGGMSVVSASESEKAQTAFQTQGPFDIVVSDVVMPGALQGPDLVKSLRCLQSDLPAILISGYPQDVAIRDHGVGVTDTLLMKPVSRDELVVAINTAMTAVALT